MSRILGLLGLVVLLTAAAAALAQQVGGVAGTKHNLSAHGPGPIRVAGENRVCVFCHTPHASNPIAPLWNRHDSGTYYRTYESSTLTAEVGQPTGSSRLCLSCHDGTIALTQTYNPRNSPHGSVYISPRDAGYIGTDLSDDHPISFTYDDALAARKGQLRSPASLPPELPLDHNGQLQCTTCHDPHRDVFGKFLRMDNTESRLCRSCHALTGWEGSSHATSAAPLGGGGHWANLNATTVRQAGCESCHRPHSAGGRQRLLRHEAEEANCLVCHDGSVAGTNIAGELRKISVHPVNLATGVHDPTEDGRSMEPHVECADCHNPHRVAPGPAVRAPLLKPAMQGAMGVAGAATLTVAEREYQVCYKCHAGQWEPPPPLVQRVAGGASVAEKFSPGNPSYHPVEAVGRSSDVPSLLQSLNTGSMIHCTDCHGSDSSNGPAGPHGSRHRPLLVRNYTVTDGTPESAAAYALCYGCHSRASLLRNESFPQHRKHVVEQRTPCSVCHDGHGVSARAAGIGDGTHLIHFDAQVVRPSRSTRRGPEFRDGGTRRGACTLYCHGEEHLDRGYPN